MDFLQQVGTVTMTSSGMIDTVSSAGFPVAHRVFDLAAGTSGTATTSNIVLWNVDASGSTASTMPVVALGMAQRYLHTDVGYRFNYGCYCYVNGITATVNYIKEVQ